MIRIPAAFALVLFLCCCGHEQPGTVFTEQAPAPIGPYSQAVTAGSLVFVSGQVALDAKGNLDAGSIDSECRQVMRNIEAILRASGSGLEKVCRSTIYTTRLDAFKTINAAYGSFFPVHPPARETIGVARLPKGARIEISVIALK